MKQYECSLWLVGIDKSRKSDVLGYMVWPILLSFCVLCLVISLELVLLCMGYGVFALFDEEERRHVDQRMLLW